MTRAVRALDGVTAVLALVFVAALGVPLGVRPEDVLVALATTVGLRGALRAYPAPPGMPRALVGWASVAYVLALGFIVVTRHLAFRTHALDLGYYVQLVWSLGHGLGARVTLPPMHAWGDHFSPVLYLFAPLGRVLPGAVPLLVAQTLIFAAGAPVVWALARRRQVDDRVAAGLAVVYLVNPSLHGINLRDVHPAAFAIPLILAAALAAEAGWWGWSATALVTALAGREDAAVAGVGFGIWLALVRRRRLAGVAVIVACAALLWVDLAYVLPYFRDAPYPHLGRYAHLGRSLPEIALSLALPWRWLPLLADPGRLAYLGSMLAPLAFMPVLAPRALAAAVPALAMNVFALDPILFHHRTQYQAYVLPFLVLAALDGAAWLARRGRRPSAATATVAAVLLSLALTSRTFNDLAVARWWWRADARALHAMLAMIPSAAPVAVNERVQPHLATRAEAYLYPTRVDRAQWIVETEGVLAARPAEGFEPVARAAGWVLLRRTP